MGDKILRLPDVKRATGLCRTTIYRMVKEQEFPAPIKLSKKAIGWPESVVDQWIQQRIAARRCDTTTA